MNGQNKKKLNPRKKIIIKEHQLKLKAPTNPSLIYTGESLSKFFLARLGPWPAVSKLRVHKWRNLKGILS